MIIQFSVPGQPVGKQRPKFTTVKGHAVAYTPAKTANYETLVRLAYMQAYPGAKPFEKGTPLVVNIEAFFQIPKATSKKKREEMLAHNIRPTTKIDIDNISKAVCDALNKVAYYDDSQIVVLKARKYYADEPGVNITIYAVSNEKAL